MKYVFPLNINITSQLLVILLRPSSLIIMSTIWTTSGVWRLSTVIVART